jgi:hypothetical protein
MVMTKSVENMYDNMLMGYHFGAHHSCQFRDSGHDRSVEYINDNMLMDYHLGAHHPSTRG